MADGNWEDAIWWDEDEAGPPEVVPLDLNDPRLIFRLQDPASKSADIENAAAIVLPAIPKVRLLRAQLLASKTLAFSNRPAIL